MDGSSQGVPHFVNADSDTASNLELIYHLGPLLFANRDEAVIKVANVNDGAMEQVLPIHLSMDDLPLVHIF